MSPEPDLRVTKRRDGDRCPYCHDSVRGAGHVCPACGTRCHAECRRALAGCPTLGCSEARPGERPLPAPEMRAREAPSSDLEAIPVGRGRRVARWHNLSQDENGRFLGRGLLGTTTAAAALYLGSMLGVTFGAGFGAGLLCLVGAVILAGLTVFAFFWVAERRRILALAREQYFEGSPTGAVLAVERRTEGSGEDERTTYWGRVEGIPGSFKLDPQSLQAKVGTLLNLHGAWTGGPWVLEFEDGQLSIVSDFEP